MGSRLFSAAWKSSDHRDSPKVVTPRLYSAVRTYNFSITKNSYRRAIALPTVEAYIPRIRWFDKMPRRRQETLPSRVAERRAATRMEFNASVTVTGEPERGDRIRAAGTLQNISATGAFFHLERQLPPGGRVVLYVHCEHPAKHRVRIRFPAEVVRVCRGTDWEVAVRFRGRYRFFLASLDGLPVQ